MNRSNIATPHRLVICLLLVAGNALGGQERSIDLNDGSVVVGEVLSAANGTYTVKTEKLGIVSLKDTDIVAIRSKDAQDGARRERPSADLPLSNRDENLQSVRQRIMGDPTLMQSLNTMKDDPDIQKILQDPELMKAIQEGNLDALKDNPKVQNLMNNRTVQGVYQSLAH